MRRSLSLVLLLAAAGCADPTGPQLHGVLFTLTGGIGGACTLVAANLCNSGQFGSGVQTTTPFRAHFLLDSAATTADLVTTASSTTVRYEGLRADFTVGDVTLSANDVASSYVRIDASRSAETYTIVLPHGFSSGTLAGLSVDYVEITLPIVPSRYPDVTPPRDLAAFQPAIQLRLGSIVMLKHNANNVLDLGVFTPGTLLFAAVTGIE
jgi:hypothetical protein